MDKYTATIRYEVTDLQGQKREVKCLIGGSSMVDCIERYRSEIKTMVNRGDIIHNSRLIAFRHSDATL